MSSEKTFSPLKLSVVAVAIVLVLNLVLRVLLKFEGVPITIAIAGIAPIVILIWILKVFRQQPTKPEMSRFFLFYSGILAGLCLVAVLLAFANNSLNLGGFVILLVHYLPYPFFARLALSHKQLESAFKKK